MDVLKTLVILLKQVVKHLQICYFINTLNNKAQLQGVETPEISKELVTVHGSLSTVSKHRKC